MARNAVNKRKQESPIENQTIKSTGFYGRFLFLNEWAKVLNPFKKIRVGEIDKNGAVIYDIIIVI